LSDTEIDAQNKREVIRYLDRLFSSHPETRQFREATGHLADADGGRKAETAEE